MAKTLTPVEIERAAEKIRQERETFNQRKQQDSHWFILKLVMGGFSVVLLISVLALSSYILLNNSKFPATVVTSAGVALFTDILGSMFSVWKIVLNPSSITKLEPVTIEIEQKQQVALPQ